MPCTAALPTLTGFTTLPQIGMSQDDVCKYTYSYYAELKVFEYELKNNVLPWMKSTTEIACESKETAVAQATIATQQAVIATQKAADAAQSEANAAFSAQDAAFSAQDAAILADLVAAIAGIDWAHFQFNADGELIVTYYTGATSTVALNADGELIMTY